MATPPWFPCATKCPVDARRDGIRLDDVTKPSCSLKQHTTKALFPTRTKPKKKPTTQQHILPPPLPPLRPHMPPPPPPPHKELLPPHPNNPDALTNHDVSKTPIRIVSSEPNAGTTTATATTTITNQDALSFHLCYCFHNDNHNIVDKNVSQPSATAKDDDAAAAQPPPKRHAIFVHERTCPTLDLVNHSGLLMVILAPMVEGLGEEEDPRQFRKRKSTP
ncbi:hypothetical protein ACA910_004093 [Epithemia clementina (nom. ined.)]